jgi:hypothetical protein
MSLLLLVACWIGPSEQRAWRLAHPPDSSSARKDTADTGTAPTDTGADPDDLDADGVPDEADACPDQADFGYGTDVSGCPYEWDPDTIERAFVLVMTGTVYARCAYYGDDTAFVDGPLDWTIRDYIPDGNTRRTTNETDTSVDLEYIVAPHGTLEMLGMELRSDSTYAGHDIGDYVASGTPGGDLVSGSAGGRSFDVGYIVEGDFFADVAPDRIPSPEELLRSMGNTWTTAYEGTQVWFPEFACSVEEGNGEPYGVTSIHVER